MLPEGQGGYSTSKLLNMLKHNLFPNKFNNLKTLVSSHLLFSFQRNNIQLVDFANRKLNKLYRISLFLLPILTHRESLNKCLKIIHSDKNKLSDSICIGDTHVLRNTNVLLKSIFL